MKGVDALLKPDGRVENSGGRAAALVWSSSAGAEVTLKRQPLGHNLAEPDLQASAYWLREHFARDTRENAA